MRSVLVVDGANVVGATPDRPLAARRLHERLLVADTSYDEIVLVLEGQAKAGVRAGRDQHVRVVHAPRDGDRAVSQVVSTQIGKGAGVVVITADRALRGQVEHLGARAMSPEWLLDQLGS